MREFAYYGDGRVAVLMDDQHWWSYHAGAELRDRLVRDDGTRGWRLSARLREMRECA